MRLASMVTNGGMHYPLHSISDWGQTMGPPTIHGALAPPHASANCTHCCGSLDKGGNHLLFHSQLAIANPREAFG